MKNYLENLEIWTRDNGKLSVINNIFNLCLSFFFFTAKVYMITVQILAISVYVWGLSLEFEMLVPIAL